METYRWNAEELASGYDAAAQHILPYYEEIQAKILDLLEPLGEDFVFVDAGGGSGRLVEQLFQRFPTSRAVLVDQSEPFLNLAGKRLQPFAHRVVCYQARLQDDWFDIVDAPSAIVSMSAIHHLDAQEKRRFYDRSFSKLAPGGLLINGDEVRADDDSAYFVQCKAWSTHMHNLMNQGLVHESMCQALLAWEKRNVGQFGEPRSSGDDCHETVTAQCGYLADVGFSPVTVPWQKDMWAIFRAVKPSPEIIFRQPG